LTSAGKRERVVAEEKQVVKKMIERFMKIDGYSIFIGVEPCPVDPEKTMAAVEAQIKKNPALKEMGLETLCKMFTVYSEQLLPGAKVVFEDKGLADRAMLEALEEHQLLSEQLQIVSDFRGNEYWQNENGKWKHIKIANIGATIPSDAISLNALTSDQRAEIAAQERADRIAALTPEQKETEKQAQLKAVVKEAIAKKEEAALEAELNNTSVVFDYLAWAQERKAEIEAVYA
jgi:hypothetical protein